MKRDDKAGARSPLPCFVGALTLAVLLLPLTAGWVHARGGHHGGHAHAMHADHMHAGGFDHHGHGSVRHAARVHHRAQEANQRQQNRIDAAERMQDERWDNIDHAARDYCGTN